MSKFLRTALVILALQPLPALAQTETQYGFPVSDTPPGDLPCYMVTSNRNTLNLGRLCGATPRLNTSQTNTSPTFYSPRNFSSPGSFRSSGSRSSSGRCETPDDIAADGSQCGGRAASERPGGRSGYSTGSSSSRRSRNSLSQDNPDWRLWGEQ